MGWSVSSLMTSVISWRLSIERLDWAFGLGVTIAAVPTFNQGATITGVITIYVKLTLPTTKPL